MIEYQPFSVAMSVYKNDNPVFLERALDSITNKQTVKPAEIVLVVDGPVSSGINEVIDKYSTRFNFKTIRLETNRGLGNALRIATENCSNELIARMDSDDISAPNRFEQQLLFFSDNPTVDIVGGNISEFLNYEDNITGYRIVPVKDVDIKKFIKKRCPFNHMTVMFKKSSIMAVGGYLDWHYNEDYYLWIRMLINESVFSNTGTILVNVRTGVEQLSRRGGKKYFKSEINIQKYLLHKKVIGFGVFLVNCFKRFLVEMMMPSKMRVWAYRKFARRQYKSI